MCCSTLKVPGDFKDFKYLSILFSSLTVKFSKTFCSISFFEFRLLTKKWFHIFNTDIFIKNNYWIPFIWLYFKGNLRKRVHGNMQQIYRRTLVPKSEYSPINLLHIFRAPFHKNSVVPQFVIIALICGTSPNS